MAESLDIDRFEQIQPAIASSALQSGELHVGANTLVLAAAARGFSVGPAMAARTIYVFFDATCPHCARLWVDSQVGKDCVAVAAAWDGNDRYGQAAAALVTAAYA